MKTICKNCGHEFKGNYCNECGQKATVKRFSTRIIFSDIINKVFPLEKGLLYTIRQLFIRPGFMVRGYLEGKRARFTKPLQFLLLITAISLIFFSHEEFMSGLKAGLEIQDNNTNQGNEAALAKIVDWLESNWTLLMVGIVPFMAFTSRWIYRKQDLNYAEHFVAACYFNAGSILLTMPFLILLFWVYKSRFQSLLFGVFITFFIGYFIWCYVGLFNTKKSWSIGLKALLSLVLGYFIYVMTLGLLVFLGTQLYASIIGVEG